jgi:hypothetical protein
MKRRTHIEHNRSALPLKADIGLQVVDFAFGPFADMAPFRIDAKLR